MPFISGFFILISLEGKSGLLIFGIFPFMLISPEGILLLMFASNLPLIFWISSSGIFAFISALGKLAPKDISVPFLLFPFKLRLADGICSSGVLIFISPSAFIPPFILGISTFFVPFIIPENITSSFGNLIFKSGDFTFGISPSILIFALCWFFKSTFGPFILIFADGISIFGDLIWVFIFPVPLISPFIFGPSISSLLEPLILTSGLSKCNFDVLILISGWFIL